MILTLETHSPAYPEGRKKETLLLSKLVGLRVTSVEFSAQELKEISQRLYKDDNFTKWWCHSFMPSLRKK